MSTKLNLDDFKALVLDGVLMKALNDAIPRYLDAKRKYDANLMDNRDFYAGHADYLYALEEMLLDLERVESCNFNGVREIYSNMQFKEDGSYIMLRDYKTK